MKARVTLLLLETVSVMDRITICFAGLMGEIAVLGRTSFVLIVPEAHAFAMKLAVINVQVNDCSLKISYIVFYGSESGTCPWGKNGICDGLNNNEKCNFDDGDCCLEVTNCINCAGTTCKCHETLYGHCSGKVNISM